MQLQGMGGGGGGEVQWVCRGELRELERKMVMCIYLDTIWFMRSNDNGL